MAFSFSNAVAIGGDAETLNKANALFPSSQYASQDVTQHGFASRVSQPKQGPNNGRG